MASAKASIRIRQENHRLGQEISRLQNQLRNQRAELTTEANRRVAVAQRELEGLRSTLLRVIRERDAYRDKLRGALAAMEDAREMVAH